MLKIASVFLYNFFGVSLNLVAMYNSGVFRILILRVPSVNRIFPLRVLTAGAISLFLNITGAIAPMAPVLNTPLLITYYYTPLELHENSSEQRRFFFKKLIFSN